MNTNANKEQINKSDSSDSSHSINSGSAGVSSNQIVDSRPEAAQLQAFQQQADNYTEGNSIAQLQELADNFSQEKQPIQRAENKTGLPDNLKTGMENLTGYSLDDVKVHRNSDKPVQLNAHAYAQGNDIHLAPGQEKHLPHELGHVVQQKENRVKPTKKVNGNVNINDNPGLEKEADTLGSKAMQLKSTVTSNTHLQQKETVGGIAQLAKIVKNTTIRDHGVYKKPHKRVNGIAGGTEIEVDEGDGDNYDHKGKHYVKIESGYLPEADTDESATTGLLSATGGEVKYFISDRAFIEGPAGDAEGETREGPAEEETSEGPEFSAGIFTYKDGSITFPFFDQEIELNKDHMSTSGDLPSKKFEAGLPNVKWSVDFLVAPGVLVSTGLEISPALELNIKGGSYSIDAGEEKTVSIEGAGIGGKMGLEITATAGVGAGIPVVATVKGGVFAAVGGEASLKGLLNAGANFTTGLSNADLSVEGSALIEGKAGFFWSAELLTLGITKKLSLAEKTFGEFKYNKSISSLQAADLSALAPTADNFDQNELEGVMIPNDDESPDAPLIVRGQ